MKRLCFAAGLALCNCAGTADRQDATPVNSGPPRFDDNPNCRVVTLATDAVDVRDLGAVGDDDQDDSEAFNTAVAKAGPGGTIYVPRGRFLLRPDHVPFSGGYAFALLESQTLWMEPDATLQALPTAAESYALVHVYDVGNVTIVGGRLVGERDAHLGTTGEWGMGIRAWGARALRVVRTRIQDFWGDGIIIGRSQSTPLSADVVICGVFSDHNRRQGLSVTGANRVLVEDSVFSNTEGTLPENGIDIEPDDADGSNDVTIRHCRLSGNRVGVTSTALPRGGRPASRITMDSNLIDGNRQSGVVVYSGASIDIHDNRIVRNAEHGILLKSATSVVARNNLVEDSGQEGLHIEAAENFDAGESQGHRLEANTIRNSGTIGLRVIWSHDNSIVDNVIEGSQHHGLELHVAHRTWVLRNHITGSSQSGADFAQLLIDIGDANQLVQNVLRLGAGSAPYGVWIKGASSANNRIEANDLRGAGLVTNLYDQGAATTVRGNDGVP